MVLCTPNGSFGEYLQTDGVTKARLLWYRDEEVISENKEAIIRNVLHKVSVKEVVQIYYSTSARQNNPYVMYVTLIVITIRGKCALISKCVNQCHSSFLQPENVYHLREVFSVFKAQKRVCLHLIFLHRKKSAFLAFRLHFACFFGNGEFLLINTTPGNSMFCPK